MSDTVTTVYVSVGNSDDKLTQAEWATYATHVVNTVRGYASSVHGEWYSAPASRYQNACICAEIRPDMAKHLRRDLTEARQQFRQDSIAFAVAETEFV